MSASGDDMSSLELAEHFAGALTAVGGQAQVLASRAKAHAAVRDLVAGRAVLVDDHPDLAGLDHGGTAPEDPWDAEVGVTGVLAAAAHTGTLALTSGVGRARRSSLLPNEHIALVPFSRLRETYADLITELSRLEPMPSGIQLVTGPSRSADIEMQMILGMHGPREVRVLLYPDDLRSQP